MRLGGGGRGEGEGGGGGGGCVICSRTLCRHVSVQYVIGRCEGRACVQQEKYEWHYMNARLNNVLLVTMGPAIITI